MEKEVIKKQFIDLLEKDPEFRYMALGLLGIGEINERLGSVVRTQTQILEEIRKLWEAFNTQGREWSTKFEGLLSVQNQLLKKLEEHAVTLHEFGNTLQEDTKILREHSETLGLHTEILQEHSKQLKLHTEILQEQSKQLQLHTEFLQQYGKQLEENTRVLREHTEILHLHSEILQRHTEILQYHSKQLEEQGKQLQLHTEILQQHSKQLEEQRKQLQLHTEILQEHSKQLQLHTEILEAHSKQLEEHTKLLIDHGKRLSSLETTLGTLVEGYLVDRFVQDLKDQGIDLKQVRSVIIDNEEIDAILYDSEVVLLEASAKISNKDISKVLRKISLVEKYFKRKVKPVLLCIKIDSHAFNRAKNKGIQVFKLI
ncbi:MAG TPA: hypothetical protein VKU94_01755 [Geobacterales bacterium]|nr:hypothetical protein [Geobacterales bacterium]